jgi:hypothetical protein
LIISEIAVPVRLVPVFAVVRRQNARNVGVGLPNQSFTGRLRLELKSGILMVEGVVIATGKKGPDRQPRFPGRIYQAPGENYDRCAVCGKDFLLDRCSIGKREGPLRPRVLSKFYDAMNTVGMDHTGRIALRRNGVVAGYGFYLCVKAVHQNDTAGRRFRCRQQKSMVAPRANA